MAHTKNRTSLANLRPLLTAALFAATPLLGCSSNDNPTPTASFTGGAGGTTASTGGSGGAGGIGGAGGSGGTSPDCLGPDGCFSCAPATNLEHLNACTDAQCSKLDNAARLPLYNDGDLPPLP